MKDNCGLLNIAEAASSLGESAHGKHLVVFALFLVFCRHLFVTSAGNTWSWAERALSLSYMAFFVTSTSARRCVLQGFCCSPFVEILLFVPAGCKKMQLNCSVVHEVLIAQHLSYCSFLTALYVFGTAED